MKIKSVSIQGLHHVKNKTYEFNDVNYLYGPNGAGKSTVLEAIQLAILGYIPGSAKQKGAILSHRGQGDMIVTVNFDDGTSIGRSWKGASGANSITNTTPYSDPLELVGELELPIFNFGELVTLTANKLKDWFIQFLPTASTNIEWEKELKGVISDIHMIDEDLLKETLEKIKELSESSSSTLELIRALNEFFKSEQAFQKKELTQFENTVQSLIYYDEEGITGDDAYINTMIQEARENIQKYTREKEQYLLDNSAVESNKSVQMQLSQIPAIPEDFDPEKVKQAIEIAKNNVDVLKKEIEKITASNDILTQENHKLNAEISALQPTIEGEGVCPYTSNKCDSILDLIEKFEKDIEDKQKVIDANTENIKANHAKLSEIRSKIEDFEKIIRDNENYLNQVDSAISRRKQLEGLLKPEPDMSKYLPISEYTTMIDREQEKITKMEANKKYNQLIDKFTAEKFKTENSIEVYKHWIKLTDANGLQSRIMNQSFYDFAEEMDKFIVDLFPGNVKCGFDLQEKANSFSFGIYRDGQYIKYELLSSGEKTIYTLAMMLCIISKSSSKLKALIIDDMLDHLDDDRANLVFEGMSKIQDIQIIAAGVKGSANLPSYVITI